MTTPAPPAEQRSTPVDESAVFRTLFAAYPDALVVVDGARNDRARQPFGGRAARLRASTSWSACRSTSSFPTASGRATPNTASAFGRNPQARPMGKQTELVARRKDGSEVVVEIALSPLQDHGQPLVVAAIRDIGAYPRMKQALQRAHYSEQLAQVGRLAVDARDPQVLLDEVPAVAAEALELDVAMVYLLEANALELRVASMARRACRARRSATASPTGPTPRSASSWRRAARSSFPTTRAETRFTVPPGYLDAGLTQRARRAAVGPRPHDRRRSSSARARAAPSATTRCASSSRSPTCSRPACSARSRKRRSATRSGSRASAS